MLQEVSKIVHLHSHVVRPIKIALTIPLWSSPIYINNFYL